MKAWDVPGMSVAIVKDGQIIHSKGYGVKELGKKDKVDQHTQFAIASNTKAFVASCIGKLVTEKKLSWNDKVRDYLAYFELYDEYVSKETTIEDLLCHRVGLGTYSGDVIWYKSEKTVEDVIRRYAEVPQVFSFRDGYGYTNLMFIAAGEVITKVTGKPWEEYVQEHFIDPLGMTQSTLRMADLSGNVATPHKPDIQQGTIPIEWTSWDLPSAAGGLLSSADDIAKWMRMNLNGGEWDGKRYIEKDIQNYLWSPHNSYYLNQSARDFMPGRNFSGYGLGWGLFDYHGNLVVNHGGGYDGMYSRVMMVPTIDLGVVVLTNSMEGNPFPLAMYIVDQYLGKTDRDWSNEYLERARSRNGHKDQVNERIESRVENTKPSLTREQIVGVYNDPMYGDITISEEKGSLRMAFQDAPLLGATLSHWHYDVYEIGWDQNHAWFDFGTVSFETDNNQKVIGIEFDVPNYDIFFHELHPKRVQD